MPCGPSVESKFGIELFAFVSKNPKIGPKMAQIVDHARTLVQFHGA
jgi:hypothetical protein